MGDPARTPTTNVRDSLDPGPVRLGWVPPEGTLSPDIQAAVDLAERSDVAVVVAGLWEGESRDRGELDLPTDQDELIDGIVQLYYGGEEQGPALADVLFGDVNPSGKLPISYPRFDSQPMALGINHPLLTAEDLGARPTGPIPRVAIRRARTPTDAG